MKWFNNLKVAKKVLLSCAVFVIMILIIASYNYRSIRVADSEFDNFYNDKFQAAIELGKMQEAFLKLKSNMIMQQVSAEKKDLKAVEQYKNDNKPVIEEYSKHLKIYLSTTMTGEEKQLVDTFVAIVKDGVGKRNKFDEFLNKGDTTQSLIWLNSWNENHTNGSKLINDLISLQTNEAQMIKQKQDADTYAATVFLIIMIIITFCISAVITLILSRSVSNPVKKGLSFAELLAEGDFTRRIDLDQKDELGQLGKALNMSADNLEKLIADIIIASQNLVRSVEEIASGNQNLSQRTSEQASSLEEIAATVEEANASTRQSAGNTVEANTLAETSSRLALEGGSIVEKAVFSISEINNSSKKISEIITMINEISFQTNLLALNAAVEAARAGEQGRGFAVVAGEVRNLAQRSAGAAKEIDTLIKDSIGKINEGTDLVNKSGDALKEIIIAAKQVKDIISEIAASSDEQSRGIEQINSAVIEMDKMTQQNAALVEETAAASEEMTNQAQELLNKVSQFRINEIFQEKMKPVKPSSLHIHTLQTKTDPKKIEESKTATGSKAYFEQQGFEKF